MGRVEDAIRTCFEPWREVTEATIGRGARFGVVVRDDALVLWLGSKEPRTPKRLEWELLEGTAEYLSGRDWVDVGGRHVSQGEPGTLDGYLKRRHKTHIANYVAAVLKRCGIVDAREDGRRVQIRLRLVRDG